MKYQRADGTLSSLRSPLYSIPHRSSRAFMQIGFFQTTHWHQLIVN